MRFHAFALIIVPILSGCGSAETGPETAPTRVEASVGPKDDRSEPHRQRIEKIREIVARQYDVNPRELDSEKPLLAYGDELNVVEVVMEIEETYRITIPDDRIMDKAAVGSVGIHKDLSIRKLADVVEAIQTGRGAR
jgi:acyl carrier protein